MVHSPALILRPLPPAGSTAPALCDPGNRHTHSGAFSLSPTGEEGIDRAEGRNGLSTSRKTGRAHGRRDAGTVIEGGLKEFPRRSPRMAESNGSLDAHHAKDGWKGRSAQSSVGNRRSQKPYRHRFGSHAQFERCRPALAPAPLGQFLDMAHPTLMEYLILQTRRRCLERDENVRRERQARTHFTHTGQKIMWHWAA